MQHQALRVSVLPGEGVIAREGETVLVADIAGTEQEALLDALLNLASHGDERVRETGRLLCEHVSARRLTLGLFTSSPDGASVLLSGSAQLLLTLSDGETWALGGEEAVTYVDRRLPADCLQLRLTLGGSSAEPSRRSNLTGGVVGGSGAVLRFSEAPPGEATPVVSEEPPTELLAHPEPNPPSLEQPEAPVFEAIDLFAPTNGEQQTDDPGDALTADDDSDGADVLVQGIMCSRGHFNRPSSRFCSLCGISMVHQTHNLVQGVRPPLGVLVLDDGAVYPLTRDLVLGREPGAADDVASDAALPLLLDDPELSMSRVHARVVLDGWEVRIEDAGSSNGTFVAGPQDAGWTKLPAGVPTTILPGTRVSLGGRKLTFESHQRD
jgi:hypothetical protein